MRFPAPARSYPSRDEVADYLEAYAARFGLPVQHGVRVDRLSEDGGRFVLAAGGRRFEADHVVVATGAYHLPRIPAFAADLDPAIVQLDCRRYRNPSQLQAFELFQVLHGLNEGFVSDDVHALDIVTVHLAEHAAQAAPDGHTLLLVPTPTLSPASTFPPGNSQ